MNKSLTAFLLLLAALAYGCASQGNRSLARATDDNVAENIEIGKTTKSDVKDIYGSPLSVNFLDSGSEVWKYRYARAHVTGKTFIPIYGAFAGGARGEAKELTVVFGEDGIVQKFAFTDSPVEAGY